MSLKIWLPLNGNINNDGTSNVTIINNGATVDNDGKIGKCYSFGSSKRISIKEQLTYVYPLSVSCWIYPTAATSTSTQYIISYNTDNGAIAGNSIGFVIRSKILGAMCGGVSYSYETLTNNTWYHLAVSIDELNNYKFYVNGELIKYGICGDAIAAKWLTIGARSTSSTGGVGGGNYYFQGKINDVRLYNHALSPKEVKLLSQGLVLHYPLNGNGRSGDNIIPNTFIEERSYDYPSSNYSDKFVSTTSIVPSASKYILSFYAKSTVNNDRIICFFYNPNTTTSYVTNQGETGSSADGAVYFTLTTEWKLYWVKYTQSTTTTAKTIICPRMKSDLGSGTVSIKKIKLEEGEIPTPWMPNSDDAEYTKMGYNLTTEFDTSGNQYNGTKTGTFTYSSDTARYSTSTIFNGTDSYIETDPLPAETKTVSIWVKTAWTTPTEHNLVIHDKQTGIAIGLSTGGYIITYIGSSNGGTGSKITISSTNYTANKWNHVVVIKTGDETRDVYVNGIKATPSGSTYWGGDLNKLDIGVRHYSGTYSAYFNGQLSDFRAYATALSEDDILELYHTGASIANNGTLLANEFVEG